MPETLTNVEARILGSLVEKQLTTPEYYPLTLNALIAACNQKSNREPVMYLGETDILTAIDNLRDHNLVYLFYGTGSRTVKYKHMLPSVYDLDEAGTAIVAVLLLRGPQTIGELRERTCRLFEFASLNEVQETLDGLIRRDEAVATKLERQPGQKEARYAHLLSGPVEAAATATTAAAAVAAPQSSRIEILEAEVAGLRAEIASLTATFEEFKKQFE